MNTTILSEADRDALKEQEGPQEPSSGVPKRRGGRLFRQVSSLLVTRVAVIGLTFLTGLIVARSVGPEGKGVLTVLASLVTLASVFAGFGFAAGGVHLYKGKKFGVGTIAGVSAVFWFGALVIAALLLYAEGDAIARIFPNEAGSGVFRQEWLWLSLATLPAMLVSTFIQAVLLVDNKMRVYAFLTISSQVLGFLMVWILVAGYGWGVTGALLANVAAQGSTLLFSIGWLWSRGEEGRLRMPKWAFGPVLRASGGPYLNGILANVFKHGEGILLVLLLDLRSVGHYGVAMAFYQLLTEAPRAMVWPLVGRMTAGGNATDIAARSIRVVPIGLAIPVLLMAIVSPLVIPLAYGAAFAPAGTLLAYMSLGVLFRAVGLVIYSYMVVVGRLAKIAPCVAVAAVANLLLDIILVPTWGLLGVALSNVVAEFLLALLSVVVFLRHSRTPLSSVLVRKSDFTDLWRQVAPVVMSWR